VQRLYNFIVSILGNDLISTQSIETLVNKVVEYHSTIPAKASHHLPWNKFFNDWLEFLQEKQPKFPLQSQFQLKIGGYRWNEFIQRCEHYTQYNFKTGEFQS